MQQIEEAKELLEKAKTLCDVCMGREGQATNMKNAIDQALAKLRQPKCKTCGGSKRMPSEYGLAQCSCLPISSLNTKPCPDCKAPEPTEFTKDFRKFIEHPLTTPKLKRWHTKSKQACDTIDQLQAEKKEYIKTAAKWAFEKGKKMGELQAKIDKLVEGQKAKTIAGS